MVTSPINPMRYWKLEEIQRMLNQIEGYENVAIEFQYAPSDGWNSDHYDCKCGIKERLVNGEWNWLLKYEFVIDDKLEPETRLTAFQEMAERLVTDVWRTSINSFRKEQQQYMDPEQYKLNLALIEKLNNKQNKTLSENDLKLIDEIDKTYKTGKYKTNKMNILSRLTRNISNDTKAWIVSVTGVSMLMIFLFIMYTYNIILWVLVGMLCLVMFGAISYVVKEIIKMYMFNDYE